MYNKKIINNFIKLGIKTWLKSISDKIEIQKINLSVNKIFISKIDKLYLEAINLVYQNLHINKIIIKVCNCNLKFNYKNNFIYSDNLIINSYLSIDNINLENIFFSRKWRSFRTDIQDKLTEGENVSNIFINNNLITLTYEINKLYKEVILSLNLEDDLIFFENIKNKKKIFLPFDKNIKFNSCEIKNKQINIDLSSKVIFDD